MSARILLIEDSHTEAQLLQQYLKHCPYHIEHADNGTTAKRLISQRPPELILLDLNLPDMKGRAILKWIIEQQFPTDIIVITGESSVDVAVDLMRLGACDFLQKPVTATRLRTTIANQLEKSRLKNLIEDYQNQFERDHYHGFIGNSLPMQAVYRIIDAAASSKASVFITGESGTGKEICAQAIHAQGRRAHKPFIALNCAAIPKDLMESEIFGHLKGAFTGAHSDRLGAAALADGGTLFLDEIAEMDIELQSKLLRFIQTGTFARVGSGDEQQIDVRFVCATNRDPLEAVANGRLREDLYYRLHVIPIQLPPLCERGEDIIEIARHLLQQYAQEEDKAFQSYEPEVESILRNYHWPGNIRQLQNVIRNMVVLHSGDTIKPEHVPPPLNIEPHTRHSMPPAPISLSTPELPLASQVTASAQSQDQSQNQIKPLAQIERDAIEHAIKLCDGNIPKAAALMEVAPSTIYRKKQLWDEQR